MSCGCYKYLNNIYRQSRLKANISREAAADFLFIGLRSLDYYENNRKVPDGVVAAMSKLYRDPELPKSSRSPLPSKLGGG